MLFLDNNFNYNAKFNLALEEAIFNKYRTTNEDVFLLWQNNNAVIIGKNQITPNEINLDYVKSNNIQVVRRNSGGGTVYHDLGNLNYSFITDFNSTKNFKYFLNPLCKVFNKIGLKAKVSGRNDLLVNNKKISGNSQYIIRNKILHHGTILINSDLSKFPLILNPSKDKLKSKGVKSVRSRVANLNDFISFNISVDYIKNLLLKELKRFKPNEINLDNNILNDTFELFNTKYNTINWNYNRLLTQNINRTKRFDSGEITIYFNLKNNKIVDLSICGDFFSIDNLNDLKSRLINRDLKELKEIINEINVEKYIVGITKKELLELFEV